MHAMRMTFQFLPGAVGQLQLGATTIVSQPIRVDGLWQKTIEILGNSGNGITVQASIKNIGNASTGWIDLFATAANGLFPIVIPGPQALSTHEPSLNAIRIAATPPLQGQTVLPPDLIVNFSGFWFGKDNWMSRHIPYTG